MKKIIPFKKDIIFKTNISEITSISLEHTLSSSENNSVSGDFTISGEYKISDSSINTEVFSYDLPFDIHLDEKYDLSRAIIDVDDFYYEIINSNVLSVNIDVLVDKLEEILIPEIQELEEVIIPRENILKEEKVMVQNEISEENERCVEPEEKEEILSSKPSASQVFTSLFDNIDSSNETYKSYKIYIVREGDDLEFIMEKYSTTKEILEQYNDLKDIKIGTKIIIPSENEIA